MQILHRFGVSEIDYLNYMILTTALRRKLIFPAISPFQSQFFFKSLRRDTILKEFKGLKIDGQGLMKA
jgi:hypothetical protein